MAGIHLGPFELLAPIGRGAMGDVWRARHTSHDLAVAVKVLSGLQEDGAVAAFRREVRAGCPVPGHSPVLGHVNRVNAIRPER